MNEVLANPPPADTPQPVPWRTILLVFCVALAARAAYGVLRGGGLQYDDEQWYWALSRSLAAGDGLVGEFGHRAERLPLYPWFLSWFSQFDGARAAQWVIGAAGAACGCLLAARAKAPAWAAGLVLALDPTLVGSASLLLTETLAVTVVAALWLAAWPLWRGRNASVARWTSVALLAALAVHTRESLLLFVGVLLLALVAVRRDVRAVVGSVGVALVIVLSLLPWALRNERVLGQRVWLTTRGGISLYDGVRPGATGAGDLAGVKDAPEVRELSELAWDAHFRREAWRAMRDEPARILRLALVKLARTWSPVLNAAELSSRRLQVIFAAWYLPLYGLIGAGLWSRRRDAVTILALLLPGLCVCGLHGLFVGSVRYRLVALPTLAVLAALGAAWLWSRRGGARRGETS